MTHVSRWDCSVIRCAAVSAAVGFLLGVVAVYVGARSAMRAFRSAATGDREAYLQVVACHAPLDAAERVLDAELSRLPSASARARTLVFAQRAYLAERRGASSEVWAPVVRSCENAALRRCDPGELRELAARACREGTRPDQGDARR